MQSTVAFFILMQHAYTECMLNACMHGHNNYINVLSFCSRVCRSVFLQLLFCSIVAILVFSPLELGVSFVTVVSFAFLLNTFSPLGSRHCAIICGMKTCKMLTLSGSYTL